MTYTLELTLNDKGTEDYLLKRFKYGYKLKRAIENWFNLQEHRRISSQEYRELSERMKKQEELQKRISETTNENLKRQLEEEFNEQSKNLKKNWIELNNSFLLNSSRFVDYKQLGQATNMYLEYHSKGIIHWSIFSNLANTVKTTYLKRRKQPESSNRLPITRYRDFNVMWFKACNSNITKIGVWFGSRGKQRIFIPFKFKEDDETKLSYAKEYQKMARYGLKRTWLKNGTFKYSILMIFDGVPYGVSREFSQTGEVKIWLDVKTLSIKAENVSSGLLVDFDLTNDFGYSKKLSELDRRIERSRRLSNPENYEINGTIKSGRMKWTYSNNYYKLINRKRYLWHKIKEIRKNRYGEIINTILDLGDSFTIYGKDFKSLQKRKNFNPKEMAWFDTRRQYGFEIMFNAPYSFVNLLKIKLEYRGATLNIIKK